MVIALVDRSGGDGLPVYLTRFFGRDAELMLLGRLLADASERVVTLIGPGGVGKTRLLVEAIQGSSVLPPGDLVFVDGTALDHAEMLLPEIVAQLGIERSGDRSSGEILSEALAGTPLTLLLDNMEHLVRAAPDLAALVRALPGLRILSTSRTPLHISGERLVVVGPLRTASAGSGDGSMSVAGELFMDRAARAGSMSIPTAPEIATIEAICARLEGLPLAIELAAARVRVLSLPALLAVLTNQLSVLTGGPVDVSERHRALRATIAWSYDLLDPDEQQVFRELGVFAESFALPAVQAICTPTVRPLLDILESLFDQAMLIRIEDDPNGQPRFRMLGSIRDFALEQLREADAEELARARHARWFLQLAESLEPDLVGADQHQAIAQLGRAAPNLRQALDYMLERRDQPSALRMVAALSRFWLIRVQLAEARAAFEATFALGSPAPSREWGAALRGAAIVAESQMDWAAALNWDLQAIEVWEALGDSAWIARSRIDLGNVYNCTGQFDLAIAEFERAAAVSGPETDLRNYLVALGSIATTNLDQGKLDAADRGFAAIMPGLRRMNDHWLLATCLSNYGIARQRLGMIDEARSLLLESVQIRRELDDAYGTACGLINLSGVEADPVAREAMLREALETGLRIEMADVVAGAKVELGIAAFDRGDPSAASAAYIDALDRYSATLGDDVQTVDVIGLIAEMVERTDPKQATRMLGGVRAVQSTHGVQPNGPIAGRAEALAARLRRRLGLPVFEAEWSLGQQTELTQLRVDAIRAARLSGATVTRHQARRADTGPRFGELTTREREVLRLVAGGRTDREIADELFISPKTANHHVTRILAKLECHNRAAATAMAFQFGLVS